MASMLDYLHSTSGFTSENSLSGVPTPPYTPSRPLRPGKRSRLERSDSPASLAGSIHPHETASPATKPAKKRLAVDNIKVEEIPDDAGYMGDVDGILPYETESADSSDEESDLAEDDTATDVSGDEAIGLAQRYRKWTAQMKERLSCRKGSDDGSENANRETTPSERTVLPTKALRSRQILRHLTIMIMK